MRNYKTQKPSKTNASLTINVVCAIVAVFAVVYAIGVHRDSQMTVYAAQNNCEWVYQGTWYGDNRDYICK